MKSTDQKSCQKSQASDMIHTPLRPSHCQSFDKSSSSVWLYISMGEFCAEAEGGAGPFIPLTGKSTIKRYNSKEKRERKRTDDRVG